MEPDEDTDVARKAVDTDAEESFDLGSSIGENGTPSAAASTPLHKTHMAAAAVCMGRWCYVYSVGDVDV